MESHDFGGEEVLGGIRWVNEFRSEWNFGGGNNNDRDSNLIDLILQMNHWLTCTHPDCP